MKLEPEEVTEAHLHNTVCPSCATTKLHWCPDCDEFHCMTCGEIDQEEINWSAGPTDWLTKPIIFKEAGQMKWYDLLAKLLAVLGVPNISRILMAGPPGTGKSSWPYRNISTDCQRVALTEDSGPEDLVGTWSLVEGTTKWLDGPAVVAMKRGLPLVIDEINKASNAVHSLLHALLDDPEISAITLPSGEVVRPANGFAVFATMNGDPNDLDDPILDRFEIVVTADVPVPGVMERLQPAMREAVNSFYLALSKDLPTFKPHITIRRAIAIGKMEELGTDQELAVQAVFAGGGDEARSVLAQQAALTKPKKRATRTTKSTKSTKDGEV